MNKELVVNNAKKKFDAMKSDKDFEPVKVRRDGTVVEISKDQVVVGDVVILSAGDEIPAEQCKHLFDRFYRMDEARNGEDKHYGLGLAIVKAIAVGHRGKIEVKCHDGKVQFIFSLPAEKQ